MYKFFQILCAFQKVQALKKFQIRLFKIGLVLDTYLQILILFEPCYRFKIHLKRTTIRTLQLIRKMNIKILLVPVLVPCFLLYYFWALMLFFTMYLRKCWSHPCQPSLQGVLWDCFVHLSALWKTTSIKKTT